MFVPRGSECSGMALSDVTLFIHKFNNTVCNAEKCILAFLYSHRHYNSKIYCCKLTISEPLQTFINGIIPYITDKTHDADLWELKHKELIWVFTRYYNVEELQAFFHPMTGEQVPFRNLVLTHYRKANNTEELAGLCAGTAYIHSAGCSKRNSMFRCTNGSSRNGRKTSVTGCHSPLSLWRTLSTSSTFRQRNTSAVFVNSIWATHPSTWEKRCRLLRSKPFDAYFLWLGDKMVVTVQNSESSSGWHTSISIIQ